MKKNDGAFESQDSRQIHMFDLMHHITYNIASAETHTPEREKFDIDNWKDRRGTGGLHDSDRILVGELYYNATSVFEFGLGESTEIAAYVSVPRYSGVDSNARWVEEVRTSSNMDHFRFSFADIGSTVEWGKPSNASLQKIPYNYQVAPLANEMEAFDFYMIDGRYRVGCACASFLHAMKTRGDVTKVKVGLHDYHREHYWQLDSIAHVVHRSKRLSVLKLKQSTTEEDIKILWESNMWDIR